MIQVMKRFYLYLILIVFLTIIDGKCYRKEKIVSISSGTSFGKCLGYCRRSINITSNPSQLISLKEANYVQDAYPTVSQKNPYSSNEWKQLISLVDSKAFRALNDVIGCPDCADGGAEWIQINWVDTYKRVTFEYGQLIKGFEGLINELRQLRKQYAENL
jgi:hypothetical protein